MVDLFSPPLFYSNFRVVFELNDKINILDYFKAFFVAFIPLLIIVLTVFFLSPNSKANTGTNEINLIFRILFAIIVSLIYALYSYNKKKADYQREEQTKFLTKIIDSLSFPLQVINLDTFEVILQNTKAEKDIGSKDRYNKPLLLDDDRFKTNDESNKINILENYFKTYNFIIIEKYNEEDNIYMDYIYYPVYDKQNKLIQVIEYINDISERKILEAKIISNKESLENIVEERTQDLQDALDTLAEEINARISAEEDLLDSNSKLKKSLNSQMEASKYLKRLVENLAHEYRTPLTNILSSVELLPIYKEMNDPKFDEKIKSIKKSIDEIKFMNEEALKSSFILSQQKHENEVNDLSYVTEEIVGKFRYSSGRDIQIDLEKGLKTNIPQTYLSVLLENIITNAINYSPKETPIGVMLNSEETFNKIIVIDHGKGINKDEIENVFEPFYRGKEYNNLGNIRGLGLGLYIAKKIVTDYGGDINIKSNSEEGTKVILLIPKIENKYCNGTIKK